MGEIKLEAMGKGSGLVEDTLVPTRFILLVAQMIVTIMTMFTKDQNVYASLDSTYSQTDFDDKDSQITTMLAISIVCLAVMLGGLVSGITMFAHVLNVFHILIHFFGTCLMAWATIENWAIDPLWAVSACCCFFPAMVETVAIFSIYCMKPHRY